MTDTQTDHTAAIQKLANPPHLSALKEQAEADLDGPTTNETPKLREPDPRDGREYTFQLNHTDHQGKVWDGEFKTKILSIRERQLVGILRSRMAGGISIQNLDGLTAEINLILAHLAYSLVTWPDWAGDLDTQKNRVLALEKLDDIALLQAIYAEVVSHETHFLG